MRIAMMKIKGLVYSVTLFISACASQIDEVSQEMAEIRKSKLQKKVDLVQFHPVPRFSYSAQHLKSPFVSGSMSIRPQEQQLNRKQRQAIIPVLEQFPLEKFQFKGSVRDQNGGYIALVQTPEGRLEPVQVGRYIGVNQGRVVQINMFKIKVIETIFEGKGAHKTRSRSILRSVSTHAS